MAVHKVTTSILIKTVRIYVFRGLEKTTVLTSMNNTGTKQNACHLEHLTMGVLVILIN